MLTFVIRGVFLVSILGWYSAIVWKIIDGYFQDEFRAYLQEEYRKHPRIKADVESAGAVDKGPVSSALPAEPSLSHGIVETYGSNAACPADIADACPRAIVSSGKKPEEAVAGGTSEIAVAVGAGTTEKNAFPANAARSAQESRKSPPSGSDTRDKEQRPGAINQDADREEAPIEGSVLPHPASTRRVEKPRRRLDKKTLLRASKEVLKEISRKMPRNQRVNTLVLTDADFAAARTRTRDDGDDDFSEFEEEEKDQRVRKEGVLVSELPFKPKADIGDLDRVTAEEFCPLTLEDEASCGETTTWP
ncbi:uncharacterized protein LOC112465203 [Temnothorax curvispinosus]|uniref:Uncharacterized protein LOC112465203 n=1 Tax=Temnothorax curvispinosus TaxID=300111 RepID=A0A6J1R2Q7_9HYME|nr:uncharacterized protein LOC112465203 [Temnothorax curvispinosus]